MRAKAPFTSVMLAIFLFSAATPALSAAPNSGVDDALPVGVAFGAGFAADNQVDSASAVAVCSPTAAAGSAAASGSGAEASATANWAGLLTGTSMSDTDEASGGSNAEANARAYGVDVGFTSASAGALTTTISRSDDCVFPPLADDSRSKGALSALRGDQLAAFRQLSCTSTQGVSEYQYIGELAWSLPTGRLVLDTGGPTYLDLTTTPDFSFRPMELLADNVEPMGIFIDASYDEENRRCAVMFT